MTTMCVVRTPFPMYRVSKVSRKKCGGNRMTARNKAGKLKGDREEQRQ